MPAPLSRRHFLQTGLVAGTGALVPAAARASARSEDDLKAIYATLDAVAAEPVLRKELFPDPVVIETMELLHHEGNFICRVRTPDGAEGLSVSHNWRMAHVHPIFMQRVEPFFVGKDARELEPLLDELYLYLNNYKLQGMAFWIPVATAEFAILDLLGNIAGVPIGEVLGGVQMREVKIYRANNHRGKSAEESIELMQAAVEETGAKALKFKVGGRMLAPDMPPGRTERLIPMMRPTFGDDMAIYADSNGSWGYEEAIRVGRMLEAHGIDMYEEPVPFDWYEDMKLVSDALTIPTASGGGEPSFRTFRWMIAHGVHEVFQQDPFYFGGMIRSMRIARMAHARGYTCMPHISGTGLGYLYMMHLVSAMPNADTFHEYKGMNPRIPITCDTSSLQPEDGRMTIPTGPGDGVDIDPAYIARHEPVVA